MTTSAHTERWRIGEVVLGVPLLAAIVLQLVVPIAFPAREYRGLWIILGVIAMVTGVYCVATARRELGRYRQPTDPGQPTSHLVTTGIFSYSRNPLYLGAVAFLAGLTLVAGLTWMLVLLPLAGVACHVLLIVPEERYLAERFGASFAAYAGQVRRWIGRTGR